MIALVSVALLAELGALSFSSWSFRIFEIGEDDAGWSTDRFIEEDVARTDVAMDPSHFMHRLECCRI